MKKRLVIVVLVFLLILSLAFTVFACGSSKDVNDLAGKAVNNFTGYYDAESDTSGESYTEIVENPFIGTDTQDTSYFSIDANTASYPNLRRMINGNQNIPKDAVRIEEMLNYFNYDYVGPTDNSIMALNASAFDNPYNPATKLFTIGLASKEIDFANVRNNLVFLIDVSGSMYGENKLPLVQSAFSLLVEQLNPEDRVSIVTYAGADSVALRGAFGGEKQKIRAVIEDLSAGGSTAGSKGIHRAYELASEYFIEGGNNRVILATDGDFNVGVTSQIALKNLISEKRQSGIYFSVYGFGMGNVRSDIMETLALNGNGIYSYIDSITEAKRALVTDIGGSLVTVAKDVKASVTFNKEYIDSYRLIGYENKLLTEEQFNDSHTDAGELGSGHTITVVYEIKLKDKTIESGTNLGEVVLKYKDPDTTGEDATEQTLRMPVTDSIYHEQMSTQDAFIASVIEFGLILRSSEYKADANLSLLITRLDGLELSDELQVEFRKLVKKYGQNVGA